MRTSRLADDGAEHATRVALAELKLGRERYREIAAQGEAMPVGEVLVLATGAG